MLEVLKMQQLLQIVRQPLYKLILFIRIIGYLNKYQFILIRILLQIHQYFFIVVVVYLDLRIYVDILGLQDCQELILDI